MGVLLGFWCWEGERLADGAEAGSGKGAQRVCLEAQNAQPDGIIRLLSKPGVL